MTRARTRQYRSIIMKHHLYLSSLGALLAASSAHAATLYVSPTGPETNDCTTRYYACSLATGAELAVAGDTVVLMDGVYHEPLYVVNSGTPDAWITFEADECATPIIEGEGAGPNEDIQTNGVGSAEAEYVRFRGLVSRGWNIGFGNGWADGTDSDAVSNGHWEIEHCAAYSNGRTGFTFFSAPDFQLKHSISAHNGSSVLHSWSSGVTLFEATGTNIVEGTLSFENTDAQKNTDGSGFIVDEESNDATFINNLAFGNGGSCLRLTRSSGTRFINNTCYHNSQFGGRATGPSNPSELYFTNSGVTVQGVTFMNNVIVGTGQAPAGAEAIVNQPTSGWTNNVVTTGSVAFFTDATGTNPNFVPTMGANELVGAGSNGNGTPTDDIGFDPRCLVKRAPVMVGAVAAESWWQYDIDIEYIQSIGGVAACFSPKTRSGSPDIGAYSVGDVIATTPGSCTPPVVEPPPDLGTGGTGEVGGAGGTSAGLTGGAGGLGGAPSGGTGTAGGAPTEGTGGVGAAPSGGTGALGGAASGGTVGMAGAPSGGTAGAPSGGTGALDGLPSGGAVGVGGAPAGGTGLGGAVAPGTSGVPGTGLATGGMPPGTGGMSNSATGTGANTALGGSSTGREPANLGPDGSAGDDGGCGCRLTPAPAPRNWLAALGVLCLALIARRRQRRA